jgi:hypothetical protein
MMNQYLDHIANVFFGVPLPRKGITGLLQGFMEGFGGGDSTAAAGPPLPPADLD